MSKRGKTRAGASKKAASTVRDLAFSQASVPHNCGAENIEMLVCDLLSSRRIQPPATFGMNGGTGMFEKLLNRGMVHSRYGLRLGAAKGTRRPVTSNRL